MRSKGRNAGKIRDAAKTRISGSREAERNTGREVSVGGYFTLAGESFKTYTGLPFTYEVRKGRNGDYTRELWIDRRENSKSLALSSVLLALRNIKKVGTVVDRPKALGDIRGVSYIYGMFYRFGLIDVPDTARQKMKFTGYIF